MNIKTHIFIGLTALSVLVLAGCSPKVQVHGYMPVAAEIATLQPGKSTKADAVQALGTPAFIHSFADNRWHYVAYETEQIGFQNPEIVRYDILQLIFDERQILQNIHRGNKDSLVSVHYDSDKTPSSGRKMTFFEQLIGNIGRFK